MDEIRAGNTKIRISGVFYEIPDVFLMKSPKNKDCYLAGVRSEGDGSKRNYICTIKIIEENRYIEVNYNEILSLLNKESFKKSLFFDKEYDIPMSIYEEVNNRYKYINKFDIKNINLFIKDLSIYAYK